MNVNMFLLIVSFRFAYSDATDRWDGSGTPIIKSNGGGQYIGMLNLGKKVYT